MRRLTIVFAAALVALALPPAAHALQVISPVEGESTFVNISQKELNLISFPFDGIRAYTSSSGIDIKIQGKQMLVTMSDQNTQKPQEVFFATPYGTYLLMLVPKSIPAETIVMRIDKARIEEAEDWESSSDHVKRLKDLIKAMYLGAPPSGYSLNSDKTDASKWEGIEQTIVARMTGAGLVGEVQEITNHGTEPVRILENEFYEEGVLAVSLTGHELKKGATEQAYIVRRNMSQKSAANRFVADPLADTGNQ